MSKHTPGPWVVDGIGWNSSNASGGAISAQTGKRSTDTKKLFWTIDTGNPAVDTANTLLATAAPDLLKALEDLLTQAELYGNEFETLIAAKKRARAALAKARGEDRP